MAVPEDILVFWFGNEPKQPLKNAAQWWQKDPDFDQKVKEHFEAPLQQAIRGELESWRADARTCLAYIILTDQFSRNMYRDTPQMFAQDALALAACLHGMEQGQDRELTSVQCWFFYMPMMHSEDWKIQQRAVQSFRDLADHAEPAFKETLANAYDFAVKHAAIVERFGRFPHRNKLLGRESTAEERAFLKQPGSSF